MKSADCGEANLELKLTDDYIFNKNICCFISDQSILIMY